MNKKALGPIGAIFLFIVFLMMWFMWLGRWVSDMGRQAVIDSEATGVFAFFLSNLNIVIFFGMLLGIMGYVYLSGE